MAKPTNFVACAKLCARVNIPTWLVAFFFLLTKSSFHYVVQKLPKKKDKNVRSCEAQKPQPHNNMC